MSKTNFVRIAICAALALAVFAAGDVGNVWAHGVQGKDAAFVAGSSGPQIIPFLYLGAKHMVSRRHREWVGFVGKPSLCRIPAMRDPAFQIESAATI